MPDIDDIPGIPQLWQRTHGDARITIAVLDGQPDTTHPALARANLQVIAPYWLAADHDGNEDEGDGYTKHATGIASILLSPHESEIKGLAPGCRGLVIPVGTGYASFSSPLNVTRAIDFAHDAGAHVLHMAPCLPNQSGEPHALLARAVRACVEANMLLVAPAGNDRGENWCFPAALPDVLPIGALRDDGQAFKFTNWGAVYGGRGLMANGENILSAMPGGGTKRQKGTSCAAPIVSGVAALLMSLQLQQGRRVDAAAVKRALLDTALPCDPPDREDCERWIGGKLNVPGAMQAILNAGDDCTTNSHVRRSSSADALGSPSYGDREWVKILPPRAIDRLTNPHKPKAAEDKDNEDGRQTDTGLESMDERAEVKAATASSGEVVAAGAAPGTQVFAIGSLGYDFGSQVRRDAFKQLMPAIEAENSRVSGNSHDPRQMAALLREYPAESPDLIWTLNQDLAPVYALEPKGPYAAEVYRRFRLLLLAQTVPRDNRAFVERTSIPGLTTGRSVRLLSGETVPVIELPGTRGVHGWNVDGLVAAALAALPEPPDEMESARLPAALAAFLNRIYHELRNLGATSRDRALNYCATNAVQAATVFREAIVAGMDLDTITAEKSMVCRSGSNCWDVKLRFFNPDNGLRAKQVYRFTIDVSELTPVTVGDVRSWSENRNGSAGASFPLQPVGTADTVQTASAFKRG